MGFFSKIGKKLGVTADTSIDPALAERLQKREIVDVQGQPIVGDIATQRIREQGARPTAPSFGEQAASGQVRVKDVGRPQYEQPRQSLTEQRIAQSQFAAKPRLPQAVQRQIAIGEREGAGAEYELEEYISNSLKKAPQMIKGLAIDVARFVPRRIASAGLEPAAGILSLAAKRKVEPVFTPTTPAERFFLGDEPIRGLFKETEDAMNWTNNRLVEMGVSPEDSKLLAGAVAPLYVTGLTALDLVPFGGGRRSAIKIAQLNKADDILKELKPMFKGEKDAVVKQYAKQLVKVKNPVEVKKFILEKQAGKAMRVAEEISRKTKPKEVRQAVKQTTGKTLSQFVKKRETTLLKDRIKLQARGARAGVKEARRLSKKEIEKVKKQILIKQQKRIAKQEKSLLKERFRQQSRGARAGAKAARQEGKAALKQQASLTRNRRKTLRAVRDFFDLTEREIKQVSRRAPELMSDVEWRDFLRTLRQKAKGFESQRQARNEIIPRIKTLIDEKKLSNETKKRVMSEIGIPELKNAQPVQLLQMEEVLKRFEPGDKLLTKQQKQNLRNVIKDVQNQRFVTQREARTALGETQRGGVFQNLVSKTGLDTITPVVEMKKKNPVIDKLVTEAQIKMTQKRIATQNVVDVFDTKLKAALKGEKKQKVWEDVFSYLSGTKKVVPEKAKEVAEYMKDYFDEARKYHIQKGEMKRGRTNYVTHIAPTLSEAIADKGLLEGVKTVLKNKELTLQSELPVELWNALDYIVGSSKFSPFTKARSGQLIPSKNIERIFKEYVQLFETKKALDTALPQIETAVNVMANKADARFLNNYARQLKGRSIDFTFKNGASLPMRAIDRVIDAQYMLKLGFRTISAAKNLVGGEVNNFIENGIIKYLTGKKRFISRPVKSYKIMKQHGFLAGDFVEYAQTSMRGKASKAFNEVAFLQQKAVEYEIRTAEMLGQLTEQEWKSGSITPKRINEIMDSIEKTQGVFSLERTPLLAKTTRGRQMLTFSRWMITDTFLVKNILKDNYKSMAAGKMDRKALGKLTRLITAYSVGGYMAYEAGKKGDEKARQLFETLQEPVNVMIDTLSGLFILKSFTENPTIQTLKEMKYSLELLLFKAGLRDEYPISIQVNKGIGETYIAPMQQLKDMGLLDDETTRGFYRQIKKLPPREQAIAISGLDSQTKTKVKYFLLEDKLGIPSEQRKMRYMRLDDRAKQVEKIIHDAKTVEEKKKIFKDLSNVGIITDGVKERINLKTIFKTNEEREKIEAARPTLKELASVETIKLEDKGDGVTARDIVDKAILLTRTSKTDFSDVLKVMFTNEKIQGLTNGQVIFDRLYGLVPFQEIDSAVIKKERGFENFIKETKLDHTVPIELGGDNSEDNLRVVTTETWEKYTPQERFLIDLFQKGKIEQDKAAQLLIDLKNDQITEAELRRLALE